MKILLVRNNIKGGSHLNKAELIKLLIAINGIIEKNETYQPVMEKCKIFEKDVQYQVLMDKDRMEEVERHKRLQEERRKKYQKENIGKNIEKNDPGSTTIPIRLSDLRTSEITRAR